MTSDEIAIGNKIFSILEIAEMNSERPGFNYAFGSILSVYAQGLLYILLQFHLALLYLVQGQV